MAINPIPSVIDLGSLDHCTILNDFFGVSDYVPVEVDTDTVDQSDNIQRFLDLLNDGSAVEGRSVLQFPIGGRIFINKTLQIGRGAGASLMGGGYKFSEEPYLGITTTLTAMKHYTEDGVGTPTGFTDPFWVDPGGVPNNVKPPMFRSRYTVGLSMRGIAFDGLDSSLFTGDGFQHISSDEDGVSVNAAKHRYEMMAIRNCARGWSHDQFSPGANSNGGDTFFFSQCMFEGCKTAAYFDSPMDLQTIFDVIGINFCKIGFEIYKAGQLRIRHLTAVRTPVIIQASRMESNNRHLYLTGLKCDLNDSMWRPVVFKEVDLDTNSDGSTSPSSRIGGTRGNVTLKDMMFAESLGEDNAGDVLSVADDGAGKARFTLRHTGFRTSTALEVGRSIGLADMTNILYNLDVTNGKGADWAVHTIVAINEMATNPVTWEVDTDTDFIGDASGTWEDVTPMIIQTGGSAVTILESFISWEYLGNGKLAWMTTGNYGPSTISAILFVVRCEIGNFANQVGDPGPGYYIREMLAPDTDGRGLRNFYKFQDCWGVWDYADPPWTYDSWGNSSVGWTDDEKAQLRYQSGIDGDQVAPAAIPVPGSMAGNVRYAYAAVAGQTSGIGTPTEVFNDDATNAALTVTYDTNGNRTVVYS